MQVEFVSPEAVLFSGECSQVVTRTVDGEIAFLDNHAAFIGALDIGQAQLWANDGVISLAINGGFVEVSGNAVTILSDGAMAAGDIDLSQAESDLAVAERRFPLMRTMWTLPVQKKWAETRIQVAASS
jgi:F-type H+-transporting ATPase subunit epsilon